MNEFFQKKLEYNFSDKRPNLDFPDNILLIWAEFHFYYVELLILLITAMWKLDFRY